MDHLEEKFDIYIQSSFEDFYTEWTSSKYKKFSECPHYDELKMLIDSCNIIRKWLGWETLSIRNMILDMD